MSLLVKPRLNAPDGIVHHVTPQSAGWSYVGFDVVDLRAGKSFQRKGDRREICLVFLSGRAEVSPDGISLGVFGERLDPFTGLPWSVYLPPGLDYTVTAKTGCEIAICSAPGTAKFPPRVIAPSDVGEETRGAGTNTRYVRHILPETTSAQSLLVVEVVTPGGHWSSYPPHKHDTDNPPHETLLEETYYYRLKRPSGFGFQRVYTDDLSLDESMAVGDRDVVLVPRGYHPVGAPHGIDLYYLNVMAGPVRAWRVTTAPGFGDLVE